MEIKEKIKNLIDQNDVCLFMKGTPDSPQCGFSMAVSNVLKHLKVKFSGINVLEYAKQMEQNGAGELLVTSMDRDGTQAGYDIDLMSKITSKVNIPVIASGGVGNLDHLVDGIKLGKASAVLAASIFHYGKHSVKEAKDYLDSKGIPVRI